MSDIKIIDYTKLKRGECVARLFLCDADTGEPLDRLHIPNFRHNSATPLAPEAASRLIGGCIDPGIDGQATNYAVTRIEWGSGIGMQGLPFATVPDLETGFSPKVFTIFPAPGPEYPARGIVRFLSYIRASANPGPNELPLSTAIQEVGLRTNPLSLYPDGMLVGRFQNDTPITLSTNRVKVGVEWIWVYG